MMQVAVRCQMLVGRHITICIFNFSFHFPFCLEECKVNPNYRVDIGEHENGSVLGGIEAIVPNKVDSGVYEM